MRKGIEMLVKMNERIDKKDFIFLRKNYSNNYYDNLIYPMDIFETKNGFTIIKYNFLKSIELIECHVDIELLKQIILHSCQSIINISLVYCTFYTTHKSFLNDIVEKESHLADFLNSINFVSLIRSLQMNSIQQINIKPAMIGSDSQSTIKKAIDYDVKNASNFNIKNNKNEQVLPVRQQQFESFSISQEKRKNLAQKVRCLESSQYLQNEIELQEYEYLYFNDNEQFDIEKLILDIHKQPNIGLEFQQDKDISSIQSQCDQMIDDIENNVLVYNEQIRLCLENIHQYNTLILKDNVLSYQDSYEQIRFVISQEKNNIKKVIFSQNQQISNQIFQLFIIELHKLSNVKEISFIQTVLEEEAFNAFSNFVHMKNINYIILYKSYFLQNEIWSLLGKKIVDQINHNAYYLLDRKNKTAERFIIKQLLNQEMLIAKKQEPHKLSEQEIVYLNTLKMNENKQKTIQFYINTKFLECESNVSEEFIKKYKDKLYDEVNNQFKDNLIQTIKKHDIETLIKYDDINVLNFPILVIILSSLQSYNQNSSTLKTFIKLISKLKSIKTNASLINFFEIRYILKDLNSENDQIALKNPFYMNYDMFIDFYKNHKYNKRLLNGQIIQEKIKSIHPWLLLDHNLKLFNPNVIQFSGNKAMCFLNILGELNPKVIQKMKLGLDLSDIFISDLQFNMISFNKILPSLVELHLEKFNDILEMSFLNDVFEQANQLQLLNLSDMNLTNEKLKNIKFQKMPQSLRILNLSENTALRNLSFINDVFFKCSNLQAIGLRNVDLFFQQKYSTIQFQLIPESVQKIDMSFNQITNHKTTQLEFLNQIFRRCTNLTHIFLINCGIINYSLAPVNFQLLKTSQSSFVKFDLKSNYQLKSLQFMNDILDLCTSYTSLQLINMDLNLSKIYTMDFLACRYIIQLNLSSNKSIENFKFINELIVYAPNFSSLILEDVDLTQNKLTEINIQNLCQQLTELNISKNKEFDGINFLNQIFSFGTKLIELNLSEINLNDYKLQFLAFETIDSPNLTAITITKNPIRKNFVRIFQLLKKVNFSLFINYEYENIENHMFRQFLQKSNETFEKTLTYQNLINNSQEVEAEAFLQREERLLQQKYQQQQIQRSNTYRSQNTNQNLSSNRELRIYKLESQLPKKLQDNDIINIQREFVSQLEEEYMKGSVSFYDFEYEQASIGQWSSINLSNLKCLSDIDLYSCRKECLSYLISLDLTGFSTMNGSFQFLNQIFQHAIIMKKLNLSKCNLTDQDVYSISFKSKSLEELNLSHNDQIQNFSFLNKILQNCQKLLVLKLQDMDLNDEKIFTIDFKYLRFTKIKTLDFSQNYAIQDFEFLNQIILHSRYLEQLLLQDIDIVDEQVNQILFYKLKYTCLKKFVLSQNDQLTNFTFINHIFHYSPQLDHLIISDQDIYSDPNFYDIKQLKALETTHALSQPSPSQFNKMTPVNSSNYLERQNQFQNQNLYETPQKNDHILIQKLCSNNLQNQQPGLFQTIKSNQQSELVQSQQNIDYNQQDQNGYLNNSILSQQSNSPQKYITYQEYNNKKNKQGHDPNNIRDHQSSYSPNQSPQKLKGSRQLMSQNDIMQSNLKRMNSDIEEILNSGELDFSSRKFSNRARSLSNHSENTQQNQFYQYKDSQRRQCNSEDKNQSQIDNTEFRQSQQSRSSLKLNQTPINNKKSQEDLLKSSQNVKWADLKQKDDENNSHITLSNQGSVYDKAQQFKNEQQIQERTPQSKQKQENKSVPQIITQPKINSDIDQKNNTIEYFRSTLDQFDTKWQNKPNKKNNDKIKQVPDNEYMNKEPFFYEQYKEQLKDQNEVIQFSKMIKDNLNNGDQHYLQAIQSNIQGDLDKKHKAANMNQMQVISSSQEMQNSDIFEENLSQYTQGKYESKVIKQDMDDLSIIQNSLNLQQFLIDKNPPYNPNLQVQKIRYDDYSQPNKPRISLDIFNTTTNSTTNSIHLKKPKKECYNDIKDTQFSSIQDRKKTADKLIPSNQIQKKQKEKKPKNIYGSQQRVVKTPIAFLNDIFSRSQKMYNRIEKEYEGSGNQLTKKSKQQNSIKIIDFAEEVQNSHRFKENENKETQNPRLQQIECKQNEDNQQASKHMIKFFKQDEQTKQDGVLQKKLSRVELDFADEFEQMVIDNQEWQVKQQIIQQEEEKRRKQEEMMKKEEDKKRKIEEKRKRNEELRRKEEEIKRKEEDLRIQEIENQRKQEELKLKEQQMIQLMQEQNQNTPYLNYFINNNNQQNNKNQKTITVNEQNNSANVHIFNKNQNGQIDNSIQNAQNQEQIQQIKQKQIQESQLSNNYNNQHHLNQQKNQQPQNLQFEVNPQQIQSEIQSNQHKNKYQKTISVRDTPKNNQNSEENKKDTQLALLNQNNSTSQFVTFRNVDKQQFKIPQTNQEQLLNKQTLPIEGNQIKQTQLDSYQEQKKHIDLSNIQEQNKELKNQNQIIQINSQNSIQEQFSNQFDQRSPNNNISSIQQKNYQMLNSKSISIDSLQQGSKDSEYQMHTNKEIELNKPKPNKIQENKENIVSPQGSTPSVQDSKKVYKESESQSKEPLCSIDKNISNKKSFFSMQKEQQNKISESECLQPPTVQDDIQYQASVSLNSQMPLLQNSEQSNQINSISLKGNSKEIFSNKQIQTQTPQGCQIAIQQMSQSQNKNHHKQVSQAEKSQSINNEQNQKKDELQENSVSLYDSDGDSQIISDDFSPSNKKQVPQIKQKVCESLSIQNSKQSNQSKNQTPQNKKTLQQPQAQFNASASKNIDIIQSSVEQSKESLLNSRKHQDVQSKLVSSQNRQKEDKKEIKNLDNSMQSSQLSQKQSDQYNQNTKLDNKKRTQINDNEQVIEYPEQTQIEYTNGNENSVLYQKNVDISQSEHNQTDIHILQQDYKEDEEINVNDYSELKDYDKYKTKEMDDYGMNVSQVQLLNNKQALDNSVSQIVEMNQKDDDDFSEPENILDNSELKLKQMQNEELKYYEFLECQDDLDLKEIRNSQTEIIELNNIRGDKVCEIIEQIIYNASSSLKVLKLENLNLNDFKMIDVYKSRLDLNELSLKKSIIPNMNFLNTLVGVCNKNLTCLNIEDLEITDNKAQTNLSVNIFDQIQDLSISGDSTLQFFQNSSFFNLIFNRCFVLSKLKLNKTFLDFTNIRLKHFIYLQNMDLSYNPNISINFINEIISNSSNLIHLKLNGISLTSDRANQLMFEKISLRIKTISFADNPIDFSQVEQLKFLKNLLRYTKSSLDYFIIDNMFTQPYHVLQRVCIEEDKEQQKENEEQNENDQDNNTNQKTQKEQNQEKFNQNKNKEVGLQKKIKYRALVEFILKNKLSAPQLYTGLTETLEDHIIDVIFQERTTCENIILNDLILSSLIQTRDFYLQNRDVKSDIFIFSPLEVRFQMINYKRRFTLDMLAKFSSKTWYNTYNSVFIGNKDYPRNKQMNFQMLNNSYEYIIGYSSEKNEIFETFYKQDSGQREKTYYDVNQILSSTLYSHLKRVFLPLKLALKFEKKCLNEGKAIKMLNFMPPSQLWFNDKVSNQFLKCWYCINYLSPLTSKTQLQLNRSRNSTNFYDISIANRFISYYYSRQIDYLTSNCFILIFQFFYSIILKLFYYIFKVFASHQQPFLFDFTIVQLNHKLKSYNSLEVFLCLIYISYLIVSVAIITLFNMLNLNYEEDLSSIQINQNNHIIFVIFQAIVVIIDVALLNFLKKQVQTIQQRKMSFLKFRYLSISASFKLQQIYKIFHAQLKSFNFYFNYCCISILFVSEIYEYLIPSIAFVSISVILDIFSMIHSLIKQMKYNKKYVMPTYKIDRFITLTEVTNLFASHHFIKEYSPSNYLEISGVIIDKITILEQLKFFMYNLPQTILLFLFDQNYENNILIKTSLVFNVICLVLLFIKIISYNPTVVNQEIFDEINQKKKNKLISLYESKIFELQKYHLKKRHHETLKYIRFSQQNKRTELLKLGHNKVIYKQYFESDKNMYCNLINEIQYNLDITQYFEQ